MATGSGRSKGEFLPFSAFDTTSEGLYRCKLCGLDITTTRGASRTTARRNHTVAECAKVLLDNNLDQQGIDIALGQAGKSKVALTAALYEARAAQQRIVDEFVGLRLAKKFVGASEVDGKSVARIYHGKVEHRVHEPVMDESGVQQVVWHVSYEDGDEEDLNRVELLDAVALLEEQESAAANPGNPPMTDEAEFEIQEDDEQDHLIGKRVAKEFIVDGESILHYGIVHSKERLLVRVQSDRSHEQVWNIHYDDRDYEQMNRFQLAEAILLATNSRGSAEAEAEFFYEDVETRDIEEDVESAEEMLADSPDPHPLADLGKDVEDFVLLEPFDTDVIQDIDEKWLEPLQPHEPRNIFSYIVDWARDKLKDRISDTALKTRLRREKMAYGPELPGDIRGIRAMLSCRSLRDVERHRCMTPGCCYSWLGSVDPKLYNANDKCPDCHKSRYKVVKGKLAPTAVWYYFGIPQAIAQMFREPVFVKAWKQNMDMTINAFQKSAEAERLNAATNGEALADANGLYILYADGFQAHQDDRHNITGCGISSLDLPMEFYSKEANQKPVAVITAPEPSNTFKVMKEVVLDIWRLGAYGMFVTCPLTGEHILHKGYLASVSADRVARLKAEQRASNGGITQCSKCRTPATLRDPDDPSNTHNYVGGYLEPFLYLLDVAKGEELFYAGDERLRVDHKTIVQQGLLVETMKADIKNGGRTTKEELKNTMSATGSNGLSEFLRVLKYTDGTLLYDYPICHLLCLGLYPQILKQIRDILGVRFIVVLRRADTRATMIRRPSEMSRPIRKLVPDSSDNICSGWAIEDTIHHAENIGPLTFYSCLLGGAQRNFLKFGRPDRPADRSGPDDELLDQLFHMVWRLVSIMMFLLRGADDVSVTTSDDQVRLQQMNARIRRRRNNFDADVHVFCQLVEAIFGPKGCKPNLHDLFCVVGWLLRRKGHPKFELVIERLMHFLKRRVRGPLREAETILMDLLLLERVQEMQFHPDYEEQPLLHIQIHKEDTWGGDPQIRMRGMQSYISGDRRQILINHLKDLLARLTAQEWEDLQPWAPDDYQRTDLIFEEYTAASSHGVVLTCAAATQNRKTCDNFFLYQVQAHNMEEEDPPIEPTALENYSLNHVPRDYEHMVEDYLANHYVCQVQDLFIVAAEDGRTPFRVAVVRSWPVSRHALCPRYVGHWESGENDAELMAMLIPSACVKVTALIPAALPAEQLLRHDFDAKVTFTEVRARSGVVTKHNTQLGDPDGDEDV